MNRSQEKEMMDLPGNPPELLREDLRNLRTINRYVGGYRSVMRGLEWLIRKERMLRFSLLDVGTGSGDIPAVIVEWARSKAMDVRIVALEPEPVTAEEAAHQTRRFPEVGILSADGAAPPFHPGSFDFVLSSQLLHHFSEDAIVALLKSWSRVARKAIIVSDLVRHPVAYYGIRLITSLFTRNVMTLTDAPLSVRRAFTINEWRDLFRRAEVGPFVLIPIFPYRHTTIIFVSA